MAVRARIRGVALPALIAMVVGIVACGREVPDVDLRAPVEIESRDVLPGLEIGYYEGSFTSTAGLTRDSLRRVGAVPRIGLTGTERPQRFGLRFSGYMRVPESALYTFELTSDDGAYLAIGDQVVINIGDLSDLSIGTASIGLKKGYHPIRVLYFQAVGERELKLTVRQNETEPEEVPASWLYFRR
jgi:hexosaminidase